MRRQISASVHGEIVDDAPPVADDAKMGLNELAKHLSDRSRIGMNAALADRLGLRSEDATRGQLLAQQEDDRAHLAVHLLGAYVVDDTDLWGDGEIYYFAVPVLVDTAGKATWDPLCGLPTGAPPHKCGSLEWMTNLSLKDPPLLAVIPPSDEVGTCVLRIGVYDDDAKPADVPKAIEAGLEALAACSRDPLSGADQLITPVRDAILKSLCAEEDDILMDQDILLRRGQTTRFGVGFIGSEMNAMVRLYYLVSDAQRTQTAGPFQLHRGQMEPLSFASPLQPGGRLTVFARGAEVNVSGLGVLTTDAPFLNRSLDTAAAKSLGGGITVTGQGPAKVVAFYTPP